MNSVKLKSLNWQNLEQKQIPIPNEGMLNSGERERERELSVTLWEEWWDGRQTGGEIEARDSRVAFT